MGLPLARQHYPAHRAQIDEISWLSDPPHRRPLSNPTDGALAIFPIREAAGEFIEGDPFVLNGVVRQSTVPGWNEVLGNWGRMRGRVRG